MPRSPAWASPGRTSPGSRRSAAPGSARARCSRSPGAAYGGSKAKPGRNAYCAAVDRRSAYLVFDARVAPAHGELPRHEIVRLEHVTERVVEAPVDVVRHPAAAQFGIQVVGEPAADADLGKAVEDQPVE